MKLRTDFSDEHYKPDLWSSDLMHDAMAAHALLQAMGEFDSFSVRYAKQRAAEILAGWLGEE